MNSMNAVTIVTIVRSVVLFLLAGLCEIGGGYLIWHWWKKSAPLSVGLLGAVLLVVYGILPAVQPAGNFGRVYAAYGGIFIVMSLLWDWRFDGRVPDRADCWGALLCLIGVAVIMYWPRGAAPDHPDTSETRRIENERKADTGINAHINSRGMPSHTT